MEELNQLLTDSRVSTVLGTLKSLIDLKSPTLWSTIGALAGKEIVNVPTCVTWAGVAVVGAIQIGAHIIDEGTKNRAAIRKTAFSYLYYVKKDLL